MGRKKNFTILRQLFVVSLHLDKRDSIDIRFETFIQICCMVFVVWIEESKNMN